MIRNNNMVPPPRILSMEEDDSAELGIAGSVTISSTERVQMWNQRILKRLRRSVNTDEEVFLNGLMGEYVRIVTDQNLILRDRCLLRDKILSHMHGLHLLYSRLKEQKPMKTSKYFEEMQKLLGLICNLEMEIVSSIKNRPAPYSAQVMIHVLHMYLHDELNRILDVLLQLNDRYLYVEAYKTAMNLVYKYFLTTVPVQNISDLNFCRYFLIYQKWKRIIKHSYHERLDEIMYYRFNRSPTSIMKSKLLKKILYPRREVTTIVDGYINDVDGKVIQYLKYSEQSKEVEITPLDKNGNAKVVLSETNFSIEFIHFTFHNKTIIQRPQSSDSDGLLGISSNSIADAIHLIEESDSSDIEFMPDRDDERVNIPTITIDTEVTLQLPSPSTETPADVSKLAPMFDSISISARRNDSAEKDASASIDWILKDKDSSQYSKELIDMLKFSFTELWSRVKSSGKQFGIENEKVPMSNEHLLVLQKISNLLEQCKTTPASTSVKNQSDLTECISQKDPSFLVNIEEQAKTVLFEETNKVNAEVSQKLQTSNSEKEENMPTLKRAVRHAEIQTDDVTVTSPTVYNLRDTLETPPSDPEHCITPPSTSSVYFSPNSDYLKEDSMFNDTNSISIKSGDSATQVTAGLLEAEGNYFKSHQESFDSYSQVDEQSTTSNCSEKDFVVNTPNNLERESPSVLNKYSMNVNGSLEMPQLEPEILPKSNNIDPLCSKSCLEDIATADATNSREIIEVVHKKKNRRVYMGKKSPKVRRHYDSSVLEKLTNSYTEDNVYHGNTRSESAFLSNNEKTIKEFPSPAYEAIPPHELQKQLKEVRKRGRPPGILKTSKPSTSSTEMCNSPMEGVPSSSNESVPKRSVYTRAATKRKQKTQATPPKTKRVNFSETDTIVHFVRDQPRRISHSIAEYAKDSLCVNNIHKQDNKLIYMEPCIPIEVMSFSKFLEEHKLRQINSYTKNANNVFLNKAISLKEEPIKSPLLRYDYNKTEKNGESPSTSTQRYSSIIFRKTADPASYPTEESSKQIMDFVNCENSQAEDIIQNVLNFYINASVTSNLDIPMNIKTFDNLIKYLLGCHSSNDSSHLKNKKFNKIEIRISHDESSYEKYQEKEVPLKKRKVVSSMGNEEDCMDQEDSINSVKKLYQKIALKANRLFPSNIEMFLFVDNSENDEQESVTSSDDSNQSDAIDLSTKNKESPIEEESYPAGQVMSIADVQESPELLSITEVQESQQIMNKTFKTPAERKEFPGVPTLCYPGDPIEFYPDATPIITDQFNVNNHTYNNPTINYHLSNMPCCRLHCLSVGSFAVLPCSSMQLESSTPPPTSYDEVAKQNAIVDKDSTSYTNIRENMLP